MYADEISNLSSKSNDMIVPKEAVSEQDGLLRLAVITYPAVPDATAWGDVLVCHAPAAEKSAVEMDGVMSLHSMRLTAIGEGIMGCTPRGEGPLLVGSAGGLGWILRSYVRHAMTVVYAELPCSLPGARRLMAEGALGSSWRFFSEAAMGTGEGDVLSEPLSVEDEALYASLQRSRKLLEPLAQGLLSLDAGKRVTGTAVMDMMTHLSELVGCGTVCRGCYGGLLSCFTSRLAELYALIWLCIAQDLSLDRQLWYRVERGAEDDARLALWMGFSCPVDADADKEDEEFTRPAAQVMRCLSFCQDMAERNDCMFLWSMEGSLPDTGAREGVAYRPLTVSLVFGGDPAHEPWGDFKHPLLWPLGADGHDPYGL